MDAFACYLRLRSRFGPREVFLLESGAGPAVDTTRAVIGVQSLLTLRVVDGAVVFDGVPRLAADVLRRARERGLLRPDVSGGWRPDRPGVLWDLLRACRDHFAPRPVGGPAPEFVLGLIGYLGYDVVHEVESLPRRIPGRPGLPDVDLTVYQAVVTVDLVDGGATVVVHDVNEVDDLNPDELVDLVRSSTADVHGDPPDAPEPLEVSDSCRRDEYLEMVRAGQRHIAAGDVYQVQLGHELSIRTSLDPLSVYRRLRVLNSSPYLYFAELAGRVVLGASPELYLRTSGEAIEMRPIAGTAPRGRTVDEDTALVRALTADPKELAEHVMLVDLCRNDIGRVCRPGTLDVPHYLTVDRYSHVSHLVSSVSARIDGARDAFDVLAATYPSGTMTGAPKVRAMEIIESLESTRRGVYAGAVGMIDFGGHVNMALCIRSAVHEGDRYTVRASAGVVADSVPELEWNETLHKMGGMYRAVTGRRAVV